MSAAVAEWLASLTVKREVSCLSRHPTSDETHIWEKQVASMLAIYTGCTGGESQGMCITYASAKKSE